MTLSSLLTIAVLSGGPGHERRVSLASGAGVFSALKTLGHAVHLIDVTSASLPPLPPNTDIAFNLIHGTFGEDGTLQRLLEQQNIPYTGDGVKGSETAMDKITSKFHFVENGVPTAPFEILRRGEGVKMPPPFVVKVPKEGSSVGVFVVRSASTIQSTLSDAWEICDGDSLLIEQFISGRELTVGILGSTVLPAVEIRPKKKDEFYDFSNKYSFISNSSSGAEHICPAPLSSTITKKVQEAALAAMRALDLQVYCRVDVLLDESENAYVLEVNTIPGMTETSLLPEAAKEAGIGYPQLCQRIIDLSLEARKKETEGCGDNAAGSGSGSTSGVGSPASN